MPVSRFGPIRRLFSVLVLACLFDCTGALPRVQPHVQCGKQEPMRPDTGAWLGFRFGEAENPGPDSSFCLSTSNPSGLRTKEGIVCEFPPGIHCIAESHLSSITLPTSVGTLRSLARKQNRTVRVVAGAPAALRTHSSWAGKWTGVLAISDFPSRGLSVEWPQGVFESGRVLLAYHDVCGSPVSGAVIYGYAASARPSLGSWFWDAQGRAMWQAILTTAPTSCRKSSTGCL